MSLTVGTTLQNDKFVIEAILHQSDFGVTYQATHPSINRPIVLQSFNESLQQRSDFDQLRQKFLQEVLLFSKQPSDTVQVIDCFEENGMPFVVLESVADQSIPPLSSWLDIPMEASIQEVPQPTIEASALKAALAAAFPEAPLEAPDIVAPIALALVEEESTAEMAIANAEEIAPVPTEAIAAPLPISPSLPLPDYTSNGSGKGVTVLVSEPNAKPKKWMPLALVMTALIAGFGGVGLGLALRFKPTPQNNSTSSLSSGWFGQEQSFPPQQEWPITETPNLSPPSSNFEQSYQPSPPIKSGIPRVQTSTGYIPPAHLAAPDYPITPGIADYPPTIPDAIPSVSSPTPDSSAPDSSAPEVTQPVTPLPQPITPEASPETAPEMSKPSSLSPKNTPADAPPILRQ